MATRSLWLKKKFHAKAAKISQKPQRKLIF